MSEVIEDAFRYDRMVVASPTYDGGMFPVMEDFLRHLKAKAYQKRRVGIIENGSWAPMAAKYMSQLLGEMKEIQVLDPVVTIQSVLKEDSQKAMEALAAALAEHEF